MGNKVKGKFKQLKHYEEQKAYYMDNIKKFGNEECKHIHDVEVLNQKINNLKKEVIRDIKTFIESTYEYEMNCNSFFNWKIFKPKITINFWDSETYAVFVMGLSIDETDIIYLKLKCFTGVAPIRYRHHF